MTLARRVAKLEEALSPTQLVLRWLTEAHAYGSLEAYVSAQLSKDPPAAPLDRLAREAVRASRTANRGKRPELVDTAVRSALRETVFRFELVMRITIATQELLDREALIDVALSAHLSLLPFEEPRASNCPERHTRLRDLLALRVSELRAAQEARSIVEGRYLDGQVALFPTAAEAWAEEVRKSEWIADMAVRLAELYGIRPASPPDPEALSGRTAELVADLVEPAKVEALDKLGEGRPAFDRAAGLARGKFVPGD
jgi:hypothetical protein